MTQTATQGKAVPQPLADLDRAIAATDQVVSGIHADQWSLPTVNTEWDVRATLNHLHVGNLLFVGFLRRAEPIDRTRDYLADEPLEAYRAGTRALRAAFDRPGALEESFDSPLGPAQGARLAHMRVNEQLVHGWDLARATGQSTELFPADLAETALAQWTQVLGDRPRDRFPFADPTPVADDAPAIDRLAAYLGRSVS